MKNSSKNSNNSKNNATKSDDLDKTEEMKRYENETGKYAIWRGIITEGFKKWKEGQKVYDRDKERISLYIKEEVKKEWIDFIEENNYSTISKLIRDSVNYFIERKSSLTSDDLFKMNSHTISNISHALKEPLTTIKGFSQLLLENYKEELSDEILSTIKNIFDQSLLLENRIMESLDEIKSQGSDYDILLIEDDLPTIRLITSYFEGKGHICKGVISGQKGIDELKRSTPKLILLDIILPDYNGYDLCKIIKSNEKYKKIPIHFLTAIPGTEVEKNLKDTKADGYILKPFDLMDFEVILEYL
ncbi:MAG: response regulator [Candidatus Hodarchaeota archaeon]